MTDEKLATYRQQIQSVLPNVTLHTLRLNSEGLVNDVVIVNDQIVFRFPKHHWAFADMRNEAHCLALARQHVTLPLPLWTIHQDTFVSYPLLPGESLLRHTLLQLPDEDQVAIAAQLGRFLQQLHAITPAGHPDAPIQPSVTNKTRADWLQFYDTIQQRLFPHLMTFQNQWLHHLFAPVLNDPAFLDHEPCLVNGDLGCYHIIYDPERRRLNGLIDFGTAGWGDPAVDFAILISQYGESFLRRLTPHYPHIATHIERARFRAATVELQWAIGGLNNPDDPSWFFVHLGLARDAAVIGSGW